MRDAPSFGQSSLTAEAWPCFHLALCPLPPGLPLLGRWEPGVKCTRLRKAPTVVPLASPHGMAELGVESCAQPQGWSFPVALVLPNTALGLCKSSSSFRAPQPAARSSGLSRGILFPTVQHLDRDVPLRGPSLPWPREGPLLTLRNK